MSFTSYVRRENGDTVSQRMATWGRNHGFGPVIDYLETVVYNDPPSRDPADELALRPVASTTRRIKRTKAMDHHGRARPVHDHDRAAAPTPAGTGSARPLLPTGARW